MNLPFYITLRWFIIICIGLLGIWYAFLYDLFNMVLENDPTFISVSIFLLTIWATFKCGNATYKFDKAVSSDYSTTKADLTSDLETSWFYSDLMQSLGFAGTIIGMLVALTGFVDVNIGDTGEIQKMIDKIGSGVSIALYTTAVGIICSIFTKLQCMNLEQELIKIAD